MSALLKKLSFPILLITLIATLASCAPASTPTESNSSDQGNTITIYKSATCGCCGTWAEYLEENGFTVLINENEDLAQIKQTYLVPRQLSSCHTALLNGYVIEGHVPVDEINRMITEKLDIVGIAVAGMPIGSPGMDIEGADPVPYDVVTFDAQGNTAIFASYPK